MSPTVMRLPYRTLFEFYRILLLNDVSSSISSTHSFQFTQAQGRRVRCVSDEPSSSFRSVSFSPVVRLQYFLLLCILCNVMTMMITFISPLLFKTTSVRRSFFDSSYVHTVAHIVSGYVFSVCDDDQFPDVLQPPHVTSHAPLSISLLSPVTSVASFCCCVSRFDFCS